MKAITKRLAALEAAAKRQDVQDPHTLPISFWIVTGHPPGGYDDSQSMAANLCRSVGMDYGTFHNNPAMKEGLPAAILVRFVALMRERGAVLSDKPTLDEIHGPEKLGDIGGAVRRHPRDIRPDAALPGAGGLSAVSVPAHDPPVSRGASSVPERQPSRKPAEGMGFLSRRGLTPGNRLGAHPEIFFVQLSEFKAIL